MQETLMALEERGWEALSTDQEKARSFYTEVLTKDAVMVFPGGMLISGKDEILASLGAQPWATFHLESPHVIALSEQAGVVVYKVTAQREDSDPYVALISSTYAWRAGQWKLVVHQQTPV